MACEIENVGDAGDRQEAERPADRVADAAAQDRVAADHHRRIDLELEAEAGGAGGAAELADEDDAADAAAERGEQQRHGADLLDRDAGAGRGALVAADRLDVPADARLARR